MPGVGGTKRGIQNIKNFQIPGKTNMYSNTPANGVPSFPGEQMGLTAAQAKQIYNCNIRSSGFSFSGGTTISVNKIDIPGDARRLVGMASLNGAWGTVTFKLNGLDVIDNLDTGFTKIGDNKEFYRIDLPITGRDNMSLIITGYAAYTNQTFLFLYI